MRPSRGFTVTGAVWRQMVTQLHEEYENSKSYLLGPHLLLRLFERFRRQPFPRITLRRGWQLAVPGMW